MTIRVPGARPLARLAPVLFIGLVLAAALAQPRSGIVTIPPIPEVTVDDASILDIEQAPPVAQEAIAQLVELDAFPLNSMAEARPNESLDARTAAYMLLNVFGRDIVNSLPITADDAHGYLEFVVGQQVPADQIVTAGEMRDYILTFADVVADDGDALRMALDEQYPALAAGNLEAPLTRAGGALMILMTLEYLAPSAG